MHKVIVIGCPGSGKSVFSRALSSVTGLPVFHLDLIHWRKDKTVIPRNEFIERLRGILSMDAWIVDGNYESSMEMRMEACDTVFFLDYTTEVCLDGIMKRRGIPRVDMPWTEEPDQIDREFIDSVLRYDTENRPKVLERLRNHSGLEIHVFTNREESKEYLRLLGQKK